MTGNSPTPPGEDTDRDPEETPLDAVVPVDGEQVEVEDEQDSAIGELIRARMAQAVAGLEPAPGSLEYLRRAVPARRRRRQAALATTAVTVFAVSAGATLAARGSFGRSDSTDTGGAVATGLTSPDSNGERGGGGGHGPSSPGASQSSAQSGNVTSAVNPNPGSATSKLSSGNVPTLSTYTGTAILPACTNAAVSSVSGTQSPPAGGVSYETMIGTVQTACTLAGQPMLAVDDAVGAAARIPVYRADLTAAPLLANVPSGLTLTLQPGDKYEFQFAWVPSSCTPVTPPSTVTVTTTTTATAPASTASAGSPPPATPSGGLTTPVSSASSSAVPSSYSVNYSVYGSQVKAAANFVAGCGAAVYVTDYFQPSDLAGIHAPTAGAQHPSATG